ncbi:inositol-pentakisphosphate 2-kinase [Phycomyces nitens]|nr:inositol-pentakisphosphate 2-kinase [Phycomyces nitens]
MSFDDPGSWIYISEGNANVVFSYRGEDPGLANTVLRLSKTCQSDSHMFIEHVMEPLLNPWVVPFTKVDLSPLFIRTISQCVRPEHRLGSHINQTILSGYSAPDLTRCFAPLSTLTIEIKPKWGFKPMSRHISSHHSIKQRMCRYCMHSHLRNRQTDYCPLDLYSNDPSRMRHAIGSLLETSGDQLRVFVDGKRQMDKKVESWFAGESKSAMAEIVTRVLRQEGVLDRLRVLQTHCDEWDVEGIIGLYEKYKNNLDLDLEGWVQVVEVLLQRLERPEMVVDERQRVFEYVLSMTLKDCSVMISVCEENDKDKDKDNQGLDKSLMNAVYWETPRGRVYYKHAIKIIDLDLKDIQKIPSWFDLDQRIVRNAIQHGLGRICE